MLALSFLRRCARNIAEAQFVAFYERSGGNCLRTPWPSCFPVVSADGSIDLSINYISVVPPRGREFCIVKTSAPKSNGEPLSNLGATCCPPKLRHFLLNLLTHLPPEAKLAISVDELPALAT